MACGPTGDRRNGPAGEASSVFVIDGRRSALRREGVRQVLRGIYGPDGRGGGFQSRGSVLTRRISLVSDQGLRTTVIAGRLISARRAGEERPEPMSSGRSRRCGLAGRAGTAGRANGWG